MNFRDVLKELDLKIQRSRSRKGNNTNFDSSNDTLAKTMPVQTEMPRAHVMKLTDRESERYLGQFLRVCRC